MNPSVLCALSLAAALAAGCSSKPSADANSEARPAADDGVKPVAPPADIVGKWRHEVGDGKSTRTSVYDFKKDGRVAVDVRLETPDQKVDETVKRAIIEVEMNRIAVIELSRTRVGGAEDVIPAERRRTTWYQTEMKGDELRLTPVDEQGKPLPDRPAMVLKRVKD